MKLGLHLANFTYDVAAPEFAAKLDEIVSGADAAGFDRISVMDHYFQIPGVGPAEHEMFEAYGILGYIAARTSRVKLGVLATGVTYRNPGFLAKQVTGLDVLSQGRAWLGIGAAWYEREHLGLGIAFPPLRERYERLERRSRICLQMWSDDDGRFEGTHYQLAETLCSPRPIQQPRPPIMVAGSGERKTLRLVARYADQCNVRGDSPEGAKRLFAILEQHCADEGTDYEAIEADRHHALRSRSRGRARRRGRREDRGTRGRGRGGHPRLAAGRRRSARHGGDGPPRDPASRRNMMLAGTA